MGKPQVERIRKFQKHYQTIWDTLTEEATGHGDFEPVFAETLKGLDGSGFSVDAMCAGLNRAIAGRLQIAINYVEMALEFAVHGVAPEGGTGPVVTHEEHEASLAAADVRHEQQRAAAGPSAPKKKEVAEDTGRQKPRGEPPKRQELSDRTRLKDLRSASYEAALSLAGKFNLQDSVVRYEFGLGYLVEMPTDSLVFFHEAIETEKARAPHLSRHIVWWWLYSCCEVTTRDKEGLARLPDDYAQPGIVGAERETVLPFLGGNPETGREMYWQGLGCVLQSPYFGFLIHDLFTLIELGQQIREYADEWVNDSLWPGVDDE